MKTYAVTVDARVLRTVIVEADTEEQAAVEAKAEAAALLGTDRVETQEVEEVQS
jgi:hypothetical protein